MQRARRWTGPADLKEQIQRLWDRGLILESLASGRSLFPRRLTLKGPSSAEIADLFADVRTWIAGLRDAPIRLVMRSLRHRIVGRNEVPAEAWIDSVDEAVRWIGRAREASRFQSMVDLTAARYPQLRSLLVSKPLQMLEYERHWPLLLGVVAWIEQHPRPQVYLRQIDVPGVHTKVVEEHRGVLTEMLDLVCSPETINMQAIGAGGFCARYGFRDKPLHVRFRMLDSRLSLFQGTPDQDVTLDQHTFAALGGVPEHVFITENETNFLAFPQVVGAMVIFGSGYGFENLANATWLKRTHLYYWGDIDTHGFAILDQLRSRFPNVHSILMDRATLLAHRPLWGVEPSPDKRALLRLTSEECALLEDLRGGVFGVNVRLEQERISFTHVVKSLRSVGGSVEACLYRDAGCV